MADPFHLRWARAFGEAHRRVRPWLGWVDLLDRVSGLGWYPRWFRRWLPRRWQRLAVWVAALLLATIGTGVLAKDGPLPRMVSDNRTLTDCDRHGADAYSGPHELHAGVAYPTGRNGRIVEMTCTWKPEGSASRRERRARLIALSRQLEPVEVVRLSRGRDAGREALRHLRARLATVSAQAVARRESDATTARIALKNAEDALAAARRSVRRNGCARTSTPACARIMERRRRAARALSRRRSERSAAYRARRSARAADAARDRLVRQPRASARDCREVTSQEGLFVAELTPRRTSYCARVGEAMAAAVVDRPRNGYVVTGLDLDGSSEQVVRSRRALADWAGSDAWDRDELLGTLRGE